MVGSWFICFTLAISRVLSAGDSKIISLCFRLLMRSCLFKVQCKEYYCSKRHCRECGIHPRLMLCKQVGSSKRFLLIRLLQGCNEVVKCTKKVSVKELATENKVSKFGIQMLIILECQMHLWKKNWLLLMFLFKGKILSYMKARCYIWALYFITKEDLKNSTQLARFLSYMHNDTTTTTSHYFPTWF